VTSNVVDAFLAELGKLIAAGIELPMYKDAEALQEWLTVPEAAERIGCSVDYVRDLYRTGEIEAYKPAKAYRIPRQSVDDYIRSRPVKP
jgi:excisionase family DNA binding protein